MTTLLETRYRAVLRLLPAYYRREREEEMVETYLWDVDQETQEQSRPTLGEVASIVALAVRSRLGAPAAPRRYAVLGSAVRLFALFAVLLQAASAVVDRVLGLTWASTRGGRQWDMFTDGFAGHGAWAGAGAVVQWFLPLLWTVAYFALLRDHRRLAQVSSLVAAVPTLWPLADLWARAFAPSDSAYVLAAAVLAWASALALCAAHHRDAPPAVLPAGAPGLVFAACCVLMGGSVVALPGGGRHRLGTGHLLPRGGPRLAPVPRAGRGPRPRGRVRRPGGPRAAAPGGQDHRGLPVARRPARGTARGCPDPGGGPGRTDRRAGRRERTRPGQPWYVMYPLPSRSSALAVYAWVSACAPEGL
ncbi:hypothetical protein M2164_000977 [Streptomyces sp. SAI-208]|uniref:hypothetical protein n=1 Tax=Streptomyces sp. SAI-208 TaxID=2940550 RepID=UPI002476A1B3|nr:hypothetical protein [Streptomyces sp. SAI-208]MDH6605342.1 hypothetical protein [Streptomyces sp. SAI-208]